MHILLTDGTKLNHIGATGTSMYIQGATRDTITFEFDSTHSVDELRNVFTEANCETIKIVTDEVVTLEDGCTEVVYTDSVFEGYVIRYEVAERIRTLKEATGTTPAETEPRVFVTMAQRTYTETQIANLMKMMGLA